MVGGLERELQIAPDSDSECTRESPEEFAKHSVLTPGLGMSPKDPCFSQ